MSNPCSIAPGAFIACVGFSILPMADGVWGNNMAPLSTPASAADDCAVSRPINPSSRVPGVLFFASRKRGRSPQS